MRDYNLKMEDVKVSPKYYDKEEDMTTYMEEGSIEDERFGV